MTGSHLYNLQFNSVHFPRPNPALCAVPGAGSEGGGSCLPPGGQWERQACKPTPACGLIHTRPGVLWGRKTLWARGARVERLLPPTPTTSWKSSHDNKENMKQKRKLLSSTKPRDTCDPDHGTQAAEQMEKW